MLIRLEMITNDREKYMETLWRNYQNILTNYLKTTEEYRSEYIDLRQRDADDTKYIQAHYNEVANATNLITLLKMQLINTKDEHDFNLKQLSKYKVDLQKRIDSNKIKMELGLFRDKEKLKLLAVCSNSAIKVNKLLFLISSTYRFSDSLLEFRSPNEKRESYTSNGIILL